MQIRAVLRLKNDNFRSARIAAGYTTLAELSFASGIPSSTLGEIENFKFRARKRGYACGVLRKLEAFMEVPIEELVPPEYFMLVEKGAGEHFEAVATVNELPEWMGENLILPPPEVALEAEELSALVKKSLTRLSKREAQVLKERFGLDGEEEKSLQDVAEEQHVTRERIRQIEHKALQKLKHPMRNKLLRGYR